MIELHYQDAYKQDRLQTFENLEAAKLAFSACLTLPDYYTVTALRIDGKDTGYNGTIGNIYSFLNKIDQTAKTV